MRILVWELKENIGGVETNIINFLRHFDNEAIVADVLVKGSSFRFEKEINELGGKVIYMPNYLPNIKAYRQKLKRVFDREKYDAVWCNYSGLTNIEVLRIAKEFNVPIRVAHSHVTGLSWGSNLAKAIVVPLHYFNKRRIGKYATDYWCCTEDAGKFMFPKKFWKDLVVVKDAIDLDKYVFDINNRNEIRRKYGLGEELVVGHVGRFTLAKNQKYLLDIFKQVLNDEPNAKLLFVADGELENDIKTYAKEIDVYDNVIFTGRVDDVSKYYSAMDVFLLPSFFEGLGMVLIEAQASGTPCIASDDVPMDAKVTDGIEFLNIEESSEKWAKKAIEMSNRRIDNPIDSIKFFGYDIIDEAKRVESLFER